MSTGNQIHDQLCFPERVSSEKDRLIAQYFLEPYDSEREATFCSVSTSEDGSAIESGHDSHEVMDVIPPYQSAGKP